MAIEFDDSNNEHLVAASLIASPPVTVSAWFRSDDAAVTQRVFSLHGSGPQIHECRLNGSTNTLSVLSQNLSTVSAATANTWSANQWHHGLWTIASASRTATLDGGTTAVNSETRAPTINTTGIGGPSNLFSGRIAELAVWDVDLHAGGDFDRIKRALARGFLPLKVRPANLLAWFRFEGGAIHDCVGGFVMTASGSPLAAPHPRLFGMGGPAFVLRKRQRRVSLGGIYLPSGRVVLAG